MEWRRRVGGLEVDFVVSPLFWAEAADVSVLGFGGMMAALAEDRSDVSVVCRCLLKPKDVPLQPIALLAFCSGSGLTVLCCNVPAALSLSVA
jgi:hypothetical protein